MGGTNASDAEDFITLWTGAPGFERANYPLFIVERGALLGFDPPTATSNAARR